MGTSSVCRQCVMLHTFFTLSKHPNLFKRTCTPGRVYQKEPFISLVLRSACYLEGADIGHSDHETALPFVSEGSHERAFVCKQYGSKKQVENLFVELWQSHPKHVNIKALWIASVWKWADCYFPSDFLRWVWGTLSQEVLWVIVLSVDDDALGREFCPCDRWGPTPS